MTISQDIGSNERESVDANVPKRSVVGKRPNNNTCFSDIILNLTRQSLFRAYKSDNKKRDYLEHTLRRPVCLRQTICRGSGVCGNTPYPFYTSRR
ncbi:hypothetical protein TNCV_3303101 [Trichonephila clavipes]|nr:hypothetical protein TNCV_3303101 [Trichonephila clavipes]